MSGADPEEFVMADDKRANGPAEGQSYDDWNRELIGDVAADAAEEIAKNCPPLDPETYRALQILLRRPPRIPEDPE